MKKTRILLVDDHDIVRLGLMTLLNDQPDMEVVGEASTAAEAVRAAERLQPDVVLMDIRLLGEGGIEAARQVTQQVPNSKIVMLTSFADDELVVRAIRAGAVGYVLKQVGNEELLRAIRAACVKRNAKPKKMRSALCQIVKWTCLSIWRAEERMRRSVPC